MYVDWLWWRSSSNFGRQVGRSGKTLSNLSGSRACGRGAGNGSQVFIASMLTDVLRLFSLTVALAEGSARVTGHGSSHIIFSGPTNRTSPEVGTLGQSSHSVSTWFHDVLVNIGICTRRTSCFNYLDQAVVDRFSSVLDSLHVFAQLRC